MAEPTAQQFLELSELVHTVIEEQHKTNLLVQELFREIVKGQTILVSVVEKLTKIGEKNA